MKKDRFYNTYFFQNISETKDKIAFCQTVDKGPGFDEPVIRVLQKSQLTSVATSNPKPSHDKEFLAYDPVGSEDKSLSLPKDGRTTVYALTFVTCANDDQLYIATSIGLIVFYSNLTKSKNLHEKPENPFVFSGLTSNSPNVYISHYTGEIEKIIFVVKVHS